MPKEFVTGAFAYKRENSPAFIIANLSFNEKFIDYLKNHFNEKGYVNLDLKLSKEGKMYLDLNDWKPSDSTTPIRQEEIPTIQMEDLGEVMEENEPFPF